MHKIRKENDRMPRKLVGWGDAEETKEKINYDMKRKKYCKDDKMDGIYDERSIDKSNRYYEDETDSTTGNDKIHFASKEDNINSKKQSCLYFSAQREKGYKITRYKNCKAGTYRRGQKDRLIRIWDDNEHTTKKSCYENNLIYSSKALNGNNAIRQNRECHPLRIDSANVHNLTDIATRHCSKWHKNNYDLDSGARLITKTEDTLLCCNYRNVCFTKCIEQHEFNSARIGNPDTCFTKCKEGIEFRQGSLFNPDVCSTSSYPSISNHVSHIDYCNGKYEAQIEDFRLEYNKIKEYCNQKQCQKHSLYFRTSKYSNLEQYQKQIKFELFIKKINTDASMDSRKTQEKHSAEKSTGLSLQPINQTTEKHCVFENSFTRNQLTNTIYTSMKGLEKDFTSSGLYLGIYRIISDLGQGAYGIVKLAYNVIDDRKVALKFICKKSITKKKHLNRVHNEIRIMSALSHPNMCNLHRAIELKNDFLLEMEYIEGKELYEYLKERVKISEKEARELFLQILSGVNYLHKHKIIHRDLKPENMLIDNDGIIKIIDFGFAGTFEFGEYSNVHCGSPYYASPEMVLSVPYQGPEVDIWSIGIILYSMVHGKQPFMGNEVRIVYENILRCEYDLDDSLSADLKDLLNKLICISPIRRLKTDEIAKHKWVLPFKLPKYKKSFIYQGEVRVVLTLTHYGFIGTRILTNLANPLSTEAYFYRLLLQKYNEQKVFSKIGKILTVYDIPAIIRPRPIINCSKVFPSYTNKCRTTYEIIPEMFLFRNDKEITECVLFNRDRAINRCVDYCLSKRYRARNDIDYIQVLITKKDNVLLRVFIDFVTPHISRAKFALLCGDENVFVDIVADIINNIC